MPECDLLALTPAGAQAMCMSSDCNSRPRAAAVMVEGAGTHLVRRRERQKALFALGQVLR